VGPLIDEAAVRKVEHYVETALAEGASLVCGGHRAVGGRLDTGHYFEPTIVDRVRPEDRVAQEEVFGPLLSVIRVPDYEEAVRVARGVRYGLSSSIFTRDTNTAFRAMHDLDTGIVYINAGTIGAETHLPFGGTKATGNGHREAGHAALDTYTEWKAIYVDYSGRLQRAQIDNQPEG
jgi:aldehyde dehydrogenase (NAD+)